MTAWNQSAILASWKAEQSNDKTYSEAEIKEPDFKKISDLSLTVLKVANLRLYHEAIIKRADESHEEQVKSNI